MGYVKIEKLYFKAFNIIIYKFIKKLYTSYSHYVDIIM